MMLRGVNAWMAAACLSLSLGVVWAQSPASSKTDEASGSDDSVPPRGGQGTLKIVTTPAKAVAYIGGVKLGFTPIDTVFESGRHTLTILLNGEELVRERVNVWPNQTTSIEKKLLMPYGNITLRTDPLNCDCRVDVDGDEVGSTKGGVLTINKLEVGTRVIKVSYGKRSKEQNINVLPEQTVDVVFDFKKR